MLYKTYTVKTPFFTWEGGSFRKCLLIMAISFPTIIVGYIGLVMILFGIVHGFWPLIPAFSFWQTAVVIFLAWTLIGYRVSKTGS